MGAGAVQVLHEYVGAVRLERHTVVAVVDDAVLDHDVGAAIRVPAVSVLGRVLGARRAADADVAEHDVAAVGDKVVVLRRIPHVEICDRAAVQTDGAEQDGPEDVDVGRVQIVPDLAVAVEEATAVDVDVGAAELEEGGDVLEHLAEGVGLPVIRIVCELDVALDVEVDVLEEGQVEGGADDIARALGEDDVAAVVALVYRVEDVL